MGYARKDVYAQDFVTLREKEAQFETHILYKALWKGNEPENNPVDHRKSDTRYWKYEANAGEKSLEIFRPIIESVPIPKDGISSFWA